MKRLLEFSQLNEATRSPRTLTKGWVNIVTGQTIEWTDMDQYHAMYMLKNLDKFRNIEYTELWGLLGDETLGSLETGELDRYEVEQYMNFVHSRGWFGYFVGKDLGGVYVDNLRQAQAAVKALEKKGYSYSSIFTRPSKFASDGFAVTIANKRPFKEYFLQDAQMWKHFVRTGKILDTSKRSEIGNTMAMFRESSKLQEKTYAKSGLGKWMNQQSAGGGAGWDRYSTEGEKLGKCGDAKEGEPYSACLSRQKADKLGKKGIASFVRRKREAQKEAGRDDIGDGGKGQKPVYVKTGVTDKDPKKKGIQDDWSAKYKRSIDCDNPKGFSQRAHCQGRMKREDMHTFSEFSHLKEKIDPSQFPDPLPNQLMSLFKSKGLKDGSKRDDIVKTRQTNWQAGKLLPSQDAIYLGKSLGMAVGGVEGGDLGSIVSNDNRILDGHHRWAATVFNNPNAKVGGIEVDMPIKDLIPVLRALGDAFGNERRGNPGGTDINIYDAKPEDAVAAIETGKYMNPRFYDKEKSLQWLERIGGREELARRLKEIQRKTPPSGAPPRRGMPVIDAEKGEHISAAKALAGGELDVYPPYAKESVDLSERKNEPKNPSLWQKALAKAKSKFDVYPSAYANAWAAKWYKSQGGEWKAVQESEGEDKPLIKWFDEFERQLKKAGGDYANVKPTDMLKLYYKGVNPRDAAKQLKECGEKSIESFSDFCLVKEAVQSSPTKGASLTSASFVGIAGFGIASGDTVSKNTTNVDGKPKGGDEESVKQIRAVINKGKKTGFITVDKESQSLRFKGIDNKEYISPHSALEATKTKIKEAIKDKMDSSRHEGSINNIISMLNHGIYEVNYKKGKIYSSPTHKFDKKGNIVGQYRKSIKLNFTNNDELSQSILKVANTRIPSVLDIALIGIAGHPKGLSRSAVRGYYSLMRHRELAASNTPDGDSSGGEISPWQPWWLPDDLGYGNTDDTTIVEPPGPPNPPEYIPPDYIQDILDLLEAGKELTAQQVEQLLEWWNDIPDNIKILFRKLIEGANKLKKLLPAFKIPLDPEDILLLAFPSIVTPLLTITQEAGGVDLPYYDQGGYYHDGFGNVYPPGSPENPSPPGWMEQPPGSGNWYPDHFVEYPKGSGQWSDPDNIEWDQRPRPRDPRFSDFPYFPLPRRRVNEENCGCDECEEAEQVVVVEEDGTKKKVDLNNPFRTPDGPKKFSVYVKNDKGNVVKVNFGDPNMSIQRDHEERLKSFRARHGCDKDPGPKWKAKYWSCKFWEKGSPITKLLRDKEVD